MASCSFSFLLLCLRINTQNNKITAKDIEVSQSIKINGKSVLVEGDTLETKMKDGTLISIVNEVNNNGK